MYHIVMFIYQNLKMMLFSHVLMIFTVIQNKWLANNNRDAILNNFEEYYICCATSEIKGRFIKVNGPSGHLVPK